MKKERKDSTRNHIKAMLALFCVMFIVLSVYLGYIVNVYGNRWFASPYNTRVANRKGTIAAGMLLDRNGVRLAYTNSEIDIYTAFAKSCNNTFAKLAMELGPARLATVAKELGIGDEFLFNDMMLYSSSFEKGSTDLEVAWSGIGQYKDLMTPMQTCMLTAAIANGGVMMEPRLLSRVADGNNRVKLTAGSRVYKTVLTAAESEIMQNAMFDTVNHGTGRKAALESYQVGGKTGSAEVSSNKSVKTHSWFTGFVADDEHPLAVTVILEQAGGGASAAAPLAGQLLKKAIKLGY